MNSFLLTCCVFVLFLPFSLSLPISYEIYFPWKYMYQWKLKLFSNKILIYHAEKKKKKVIFLTADKRSFSYFFPLYTCFYGKSKKWLSFSNLIKFVKKNLSSLYHTDNKINSNSHDLLLTFRIYFWDWSSYHERRRFTAFWYVCVSLR